VTERDPRSPRDRSTNGQVTQAVPPTRLDRSLSDLRILIPQMSGARGLRGYSVFSPEAGIWRCEVCWQHIPSPAKHNEVCWRGHPDPAAPGPEEG
jgi:hypothetical protein